MHRIPAIQPYIYQPYETAFVVVAAKDEDHHVPCWITLKQARGGGEVYGDGIQVVLLSKPCDVCILIHPSTLEAFGAFHAPLTKRNVFYATTTNPDFGDELGRWGMARLKELHSHNTAGRERYLYIPMGFTKRDEWIDTLVRYGIVAYDEQEMICFLRFIPRSDGCLS